MADHVHTIRQTPNHMGMGMKVHKWKERVVGCGERELPTTLDPPDPIVIDDQIAFPWIRFQRLLFEEKGRWRRAMEVERELELFVRARVSKNKVE